MNRIHSAPPPHQQTKITQTNIPQETQQTRKQGLGTKEPKVSNIVHIFV